MFYKWSLSSRTENRKTSITEITLNYAFIRANIQKIKPKLRLKGLDSQNCSLVSFFCQLHSKPLKMSYVSAQQMNCRRIGENYVH